MLKKSALALAVLALGALSQNASAQTGAVTRAGILTCHVSSGWGFVFGSTKDLNCVYTGSGRSENYAGTISKFGLDVGYQKSGVMIWAVLAPGTNLAPGALAGEYGGLTAGATAGVGGNANLLTGGSTKSISLQPLSIEGTTGLNLAAGVAAITLTHKP